MDVVRLEGQLRVVYVVVDQGVGSVHLDEVVTSMSMAAADRSMSSILLANVAATPRFIHYVGVLSSVAMM